jgi:hypothetical protein
VRGNEIGEENCLSKDSLTAVTLEKAGDSKFAATKASWGRLSTHLHMSEEQQKKLVEQEFSGLAAASFQQLAAANPAATADELWAAME